ncbi:PAS domain S-box protein [Mucilaginibacter ximonensis]|uniref:histidine kinase n=1 Tax=Mucilaginibacter ximonensis TaxID=538021 RepID=A0ABW5Y7J7_9SPHI
MLSKKNDCVPLSQNFDDRLFRLLVASIRDCAIFMTDPNGYIVSWNQGAQNIHGYSEDEIVGRHISIFYTELDNKANEWSRNLNMALKNGSRESKGWRVRKDGSVFWAQATFTTVYNDQGHLIGFSKMTRDLTLEKEKEELKEERNAELEKRVAENTEQILANEIKFRKLIESSHDGITLLDKNLNVLFRSYSAERISGWSNEDRVGHEVYDTVHPQDSAGLKQVLAEVLQSPAKSVITSYRVKHKKGYYIWIEAMFTNWLKDENIQAIVCNFRDITTRVTYEDELKAKNKQIENILNSMADGFVALDKDFCFTYANKRIGEMTGRNPADLIGKYVFTEFPEAVGSATQKAFNTAVAKKKYVCHEDYYAPLSLWQENHVYPLADGGLTVFVRDISARKKADQQIKQLNENLEKKVIERTKQLEAANQELESFSYSVSHDLRAPLRAVNGYAVMLKEEFQDKLGEEGNRVINVITHNARLMGQLIDDLLGFSRMSRKEMVGIKVDMDALFKVCVREVMQQQPVVAQMVIHKLLPCYGDVNLLRQVILNLVGNAIKYSSKADDPIVEIGCIKDTDKRIYYVKDNGVGFDMKYSKKLFGVFQRLHSAQEFEGTGVGLALAKRIIEKHGGNIWAESAPGEGATFYFSMPVKLNKDER